MDQNKTSTICSWITRNYRDFNIFLLIYKPFRFFEGKLPALVAVDDLFNAITPIIKYQTETIYFATTTRKEKKHVK